MNIIRAYPPERRASAPSRFVSALRRFLLGVPPVQQELAVPLLELHAPSLAGRPRLIVAGHPTGSWRKAVLNARSMTGSLSEAVDQAVETFYQQTSTTPELPAIPKPLPRGARPGGPRIGPRTVRLVPDDMPMQQTGGFQVATCDAKPEEWIETPGGMWAPQSGVYHPKVRLKYPTKVLTPERDDMDTVTEQLLRRSITDYATILERLNHRPLDRSFQH